MDCSTPGFPVHHQLPELAQTHVHPVGDVIQPSHSLLFPSPPAFNLSQHQALFQWDSSSHCVAKVLEFQLQHQSFQWLFRVDFFWNWLVWSPCSPRDSQESSPAPKFESINSSVRRFFFFFFFEERNGNPLQCSYLENPMKRRAWLATDYGVAKSQPWLSN